VARARKARDIQRAALGASTAAWATLLLGDAAIDRAGADDVRKVIDVLAFGAGDDAERVTA